MQWGSGVFINELHRDQQVFGVGNQPHMRIRRLTRANGAEGAGRVRVLEKSTVGEGGAFNGGPGFGFNL